jgi:hypothetical protein
MSDPKYARVNSNVSDEKRDAANDDAKRHLLSPDPASPPGNGAGAVAIVVDSSSNQANNANKGAG